MNPLTDNQRNFIDRLYGDLEDASSKLPDDAAEKISEKLSPIVDKIIVLKKGEDISKTDASGVIETLIDISKLIEKSLDIVHCRWKKIDDQWLVMGPETVVVPGATVTVKSSKGEKEVEIESVYRTENGKAWGVPKKAEISADVSEGIWRNTSGQLIEVYKTRKGFLVAKSIDETTGEKTYLGKQGLTNLDHKLSLEEAKQWGRETGICCSCGAKLTDPISVENGIGPICASKGYW